jgi:hypothetical protein
MPSSTSMHFCKNCCIDMPVIFSIIVSLIGQLFFKKNHTSKMSRLIIKYFLLVY